MATQPWATPSDLISRYDSRVIGDLLQDAGLRLNSSAILTDPNCLNALADATSVINSYVLQGGRYAMADLEALTGIDKDILVRLCCNLGLIYLVQRRGLPKGNRFLDSLIDETNKMLDALRNGEEVLNIPGNIARSAPEINFPSVVAYQQIDLLRDATNLNYTPYFPQRRKQQGANQSNPNSYNP